MAVAYLALFPYPLLQRASFDFRGKKDVAGRGVLCGKKTTRKTFLTGFFTRPGSRALAARARALACRWDLAEER